MFATSEFPLEIPRMQTRNFTYTKPLTLIRQRSFKIGILSKKPKMFTLELNAKIDSKSEF